MEPGPTTPCICGFCGIGKLFHAESANCQHGIRQLFVRNPPIVCADSTNCLRGLPRNAARICTESPCGSLCEKFSMSRTVPYRPISFLHGFKCKNWVPMHTRMFAGVCAYLYFCATAMYTLTKYWLKVNFESWQCLHAFNFKYLISSLCTNDV